MSDIQEKEFDYSLVDTDTAEFLKQKKFNIQRTVAKAAIDVGEELYEVKEKIDEHADVYFNNWLKEINLSPSQANEYIRFYKAKISGELSAEQFDNLPVRVVASLESKKTPKEVKEKIKNGEITKVKEMKKLRKKLNAERKEKERMEKQLKQQIEKLKNADPEKEMVEIENSLSKKWL